MTRGRALGVAILSVVAASSLVLAIVRAEPGRTAASARSNQRPPARTPDIHFVPTLQSVADAMLQLARVNANDVVYDLGIGRWPDRDHRGSEVRGARRRHRARSPSWSGSRAKLRSKALSNTK